MPEFTPPSKFVKTNGELDGLTTLRFFAALFVFLFHMNMLWPHSFDSNWSLVFAQGAIGMSIFFMLSGFVLAYRYSFDENFQVKRYAVNRIARIYPIYFVAMLVTVPWMITSPPEDWGRFSWAQFVLQFLIIIITSFALLQAWFTPLFPFWNFGASWSISVEAFLYFVFLSFRSKFNRFSLKKLLFASIILYFLATLPGLVIVAFSPEGTGNIFQFYEMPIFRLPEFLLGLLGYQFVTRLNLKSQILDVAVLVAWAFLLAYFWKFGSLAPLWLPHSWIVIPIVFFTILSLSRTGFLTKLFSAKPLVYLGKISYSFYSFQILLILLVHTYEKEIENITFFDSYSFLLPLTAFGILLLISIAAYEWIEKPSRIFLQSRLLRA